MKKSDAVILSLMISVLAGGIFAYITSNWWIGLGAVIVFICFFVFCSSSIKKKNGNVSKEDFINTLLVYGKEKSNEYIKMLYPDSVLVDDKIIDGDTVISNNFKFSPLNEEDVAACFRYAKKHGLKNAIIFTNIADKKALNLSYRLDLPISIFNYRKTYSTLKSKGLLPNKSETVLKKRGIKSILNDFAFIPIKYFALSSISTAFFSIFVPLKLYYLAFALINAILGIVVFFLNKRLNDTKKTP